MCLFKKTNTHLFILNNNIYYKCKKIGIIQDNHFYSILNNQKEYIGFYENGCIYTGFGAIRKCIGSIRSGIVYKGIGKNEQIFTYTKSAKEGTAKLLLNIK